MPQVLCKGILALLGKKKKVMVNTQLLIVHYEKEEQCDQRAHSQLCHYYGELVPIIHSPNTANVWCWILLRGCTATDATLVNANAPAHSVFTPHSLA